MNLREMRCLYTHLLCQHILWVENELEIDVAFDEVTERITAKDPTSDHMKNSVHHVGLAADLNFYRDGLYLALTEHHAASGAKWKTRHPLCRWGGDWGDGNHYSFEYQGRK